MSRNKLTITKWVPVERDSHKELFVGCKKTLTLSHMAVNLIINFKFNVKQIRNYQPQEREILLQSIGKIQTIVDEACNNFETVFEKFTNDAEEPFILQQKIKLWKSTLWKEKLELSYFLNYFLRETSYWFIYCGESLLILTFKIANSFNKLVSMSSKYGLPNSLVIQNTCAYLQYSLRKISITKLLQILSRNRAETCCHKLIDCLLNSYKYYELMDDDKGSDNSSVEIYRAITRHMSPVESAHEEQEAPHAPPAIRETHNNFANIEELVKYEEENVTDLLQIALKTSPTMLGADSVKKEKNSGEDKLSHKAKNKVLDYYQEILWGEVGTYLEHVILWWGASPLAIKPHHFSQHLREWIAQFNPTDMPTFILSALTNLADALGMHVTSTSWDQQFGQGIVCARSGSADTGKLFCDVLHNLVTLCNQCESTSDWILGAPLEELPLVEQIPVLHRLDHSIHTTRLWAIGETKRMANNWNVEGFFMITHCDIINCLSRLNNLKLTDHTPEIEKGGIDAHVHVCASMREKLVSEVNENHTKLKNATKQCIEILASICRMVSLANLQMIFPDHRYWRKIKEKPPDKPNPYVEKYLNEILYPVLEATEDLAISNKILKIMCEAWLDHIYIIKIKFSQFGALQLLKDFAYVKTWLINCPVIGHEMRESMGRNEVLRKCEGVGWLLLRSPGEQLKMKKDRKTVIADNSTELMPPEMYVPNQEQWLELRIRKQKAIFLNICCSSLD